jgi:hypothetical protein
MEYILPVILSWLSCARRCVQFLLTLDSMIIGILVAVSRCACVANAVVPLVITILNGYPGGRILPAIKSPEGTGVAWLNRDVALVAGSRGGLIVQFHH